jgi:hypothetical protein
MSALSFFYPMTGRQKSFEGFFFFFLHLSRYTNKLSHFSRLLSHNLIMHTKCLFFHNSLFLYNINVHFIIDDHGVVGFPLLVVHGPAGQRPSVSLAGFLGRCPWLAMLKSHRSDIIGSFQYAFF